MGACIGYIPDIDATIEINWLDSNLRLSKVEGSINSSAVVRAWVYRQDTQAYLYDRIFQGPVTINENVPGNWSMQIVNDPEYPEEPDRIVFPPGIVWGIDRLPDGYNG